MLMPSQLAQVRDVLLEEYAKGASTYVLGRKYGVAGATVRDYLRRQGAVIRPARGSAKHIVPIDENRLRALLESKEYSIPEIADLLAVAVPTLERRMLILGLKSVRGRGSPMEKNYFWNGGRFVDVDGYVLVKCPGHPYAENRGYVREHRLVMEKKLGRFLEPTEVVHHKDRNPANNDPDNLEVYLNNSEHFLAEHSVHQRDPKTGRLLLLPRNHQTEGPDGSSSNQAE